jgi:hypothetical protein
MYRLALLVMVVGAVLMVELGYALPPQISPEKAVSVNPSSFNDSGWTIKYQENFDTDFVATNGQQFGTDNWLIFQLVNGGAMTIANGYAQLNAPDFWNASLIRSSSILPSEYKVRVKVGYVNYDLSNYEPGDYSNPDFNSHSGYYENGVYWLTVTNDTCVGNECAEDWWHLHRKMVIDVDNHLNYGGGETVHPVYMVYMNAKTTGAINLLRCWTGTYWNTANWCWDVAYTYDTMQWYYAELEKQHDSITLRLYDANKNILKETTPVHLDLVRYMNDPTEYLYVGEPHTDDYEGNARFDEITLLVPQEHCCIGTTGNVDMEGIVDISDLSALVNYLLNYGYELPCPNEANVDGEGIVDISDLSALVNYLLNYGYILPNCP